MNIKLPDSVSSKQDIVALIDELRDYSRWFAHNGIKGRTNSKQVTLPPVLSPVPLDMIRLASGHTLLDQHILDTLISSLETYRDTAASMTITLAAPPTRDIKLTLVAWCRANISPTILITFQFNATLLGGMVLRYGSHIFDWSFRRQILANRQNFPEILRRV